MNRDVKGQGEISKLDKGSCLSLLQWLSLVYAIFSTRNQAATCNIRSTLKIFLILKCAIFFVALQTLSTSFLERISKKVKKWTYSCPYWRETMFRVWNFKFKIKMKRVYMYPCPASNSFPCTPAQTKTQEGWLSSFGELKKTELVWYIQPSTTALIKMDDISSSFEHFVTFFVDTTFG